MLYHASSGGTVRLDAFFCHSAPSMPTLGQSLRWRCAGVRRKCRSCRGRDGTVLGQQSFCVLDGLTYVPLIGILLSTLHLSAFVTVFEPVLLSRGTHPNVHQAALSLLGCCLLWVGDAMYVSMYSNNRLSRLPKYCSKRRPSRMVQQGHTFAATHR
jgi:hypothetical protein